MKGNEEGGNKIRMGGSEREREREWREGKSVYGLKSLGFQGFGDISFFIVG